LNGKKVHSTQISSYRLQKNVYPIYHSTRITDLKPNDSFIFYLAGQKTKVGFNTKKFIAYGMIEDVIVDRNYDENDIHISLPIEKVVRLKSVVKNKSVSIYDVKDKVSFVTKKKKWGSSMQGGVIQITEKDYNLIIEEMNK